jgi:1-acyl-sn-glycerol-3-phosphate acyltransferase
MVSVFNSNDEFITTITPEGTRKYNDKWRTGFYYIAKRANVPIVKIGFDYPKKIIEINSPEYISKGVEETIEEYKNYFKQFEGKYPKNGVR